MVENILRKKEMLKIFESLFNDNSFSETETEEVHTETRSNFSDEYWTALTAKVESHPSDGESVHETANESKI